MVSFLVILLVLPILLLFLLPKFRNFSQRNLLPFPPGPPGLPVIGNLHQLDSSQFEDYLYRLSKRYGPLMSLRLGRVQTLVVSSAQIAKEVLKTNDLICCSRPILTGQKKISYNSADLAFCPYNDYWREMRKICTLHLFTAKRVLSFRPAREEEVYFTIDRLRKQIAASSSEKVVVNLCETMTTLTNTIICRVAFSKRFGGQGPEMSRFDDLVLDCQAAIANFYYGDYFPYMGWLDKLNGSIARLEKTFKDIDVFYQELIDEHLNQKTAEKKEEDDIIDILLQVKKDGFSSIDFSFDHIKGLLMDILLGGIETSASTVVFAMTMLLKNPKYLKKVQQEVRNVVGNKGKVDEDDLPKLDYLKAVTKEALRLFPPAPLLVPRETMDTCVLGGYEIPKKTMVYVNAWAVGRDPVCWEKPEEFDPERFIGSSIDYKGMDFQFIPFGSGRRGCPGMSLGVTTLELALSNLLYSFDWELPDGVKEEDIDTVTTPGIILHKKNPLFLVAKVYNSSQI